MMTRFLIHILLFKVGTFCLDSASAVSVDGVATGEWDGIDFYISVKRDAIQKKLDAFHISRSNGCDDRPRLYVPDGPILPDLHNSDRHPVYIDFGHMKSHDFDGYLEENPNTCVSVSGLEVAVTIPLLAGAPDGPPVYALALAKFYEKSRGDMPKINFLYPYIPVDEIKMSDYGAVVRNGNDEMRVTFNRLIHPCKPLDSMVNEEFEEFIHSDFQFGLPQPDYSFCDRHSFESKFCANAERIKCGVQRYSPNLCQQWSSKTTKHCVTTVEIKKITSWFREYILLGDDPVNILASETHSSNFSIALKYPCQE
ncbi:hypothetical protein HOLleu_11261 [Holothuria leucospilota]|uniref:Uncharacterized protein n=1 Tax=Holothuria leucospilota TaxID=206669 RepID=A0A9Q1CEN7_HOLLE|nr:hypothetical protein HOLleu_11261 [Holothuria leucospilota]